MLALAEAVCVQKQQRAEFQSLLERALAGGPAARTSVEKLLADARAAMAKLAADDFRTPLRAANYCLDNNVNLDEARTWLAKSLAINPTHPQTLFNLGIVKRDGKQDYAGAAENMRAYLKLAPNASDTELVKQQLSEVSRVKYHVPGMIQDPITVLPEKIIGDVIKMIEERKFSFSTFPVVDEKGKLVGLLSGHVVKPGVYEVEHGYPLRKFIFEDCGGMIGGRKLKGLIPGGISAKVLRGEDCENLTYEHGVFDKAGSALGRQSSTTVRRVASSGMGIRTVAMRGLDTSIGCRPDRFSARSSSPGRLDPVRSPVLSALGVVWPSSIGKRLGELQPLVPSLYCTTSSFGSP